MKSRSRSPARKAAHLAELCWSAVRTLAALLCGRGLAIRKCGWLAGSLWVVAPLLIPAHGFAETRSDVVVLVRYHETNRTLNEAFHRLRGELGQHGFLVEITELDVPPTLTELEREADTRGAVASVTLVPSAGSSSQLLSNVDVWICDRVTGKTIKRTITPEASDEAAGILAIRTVELLRSSLDEYDERRQAPDVRGVYPERAAKAVSGLGAARSTAVIISAGAALGLSLPAGGISIAPQLGGAVEMGRWGGRILVVGPLLGARPSAPDGDFELLSVSVQVEPYALPLRTARWQLEVFPSMGATFLQVRGMATAPFVGTTDSTWTASLGGGMTARVQLGPELGLYLDGRALLLLPTPTVELGSIRTDLGSPLLTFSAGLLLRL